MTKKKAGKVSKTKDKVKSKGPGYVRLGIANAKRGGASSYADVGWHVGLHLHSELEDRLDVDQATAIIKELEQHLANEEFDIALSKLNQDANFIMKLIPKSRQSSFISGMYKAYLEDRLWG